MKLGHWLYWYNVSLCTKLLRIKAVHQRIKSATDRNADISAAKLHWLLMTTLYVQALNLSKYSR